MLNFILALLKTNEVKEGCNAFHWVHLFSVFIVTLKFRYRLT